ncbi:pseudaminic acid biosynthesis-associated protein PseG [[Leptolyngbya] sp. PCC 7376]|uniref:UDP-2,4-diacetamido-2,4, 6-trideoxy-beta-L-altropyranose hydrolase n=1 Tax=[Leptolyngbya] sp. PCC 7376 TaxID=111781 RepID=UPI00029F1EA3|nr:UDP-2,4-diacetamido-2,4,6-trideoxy-beta-L-altropyranose hydrolase [[Leptolyngbya] sp. PCC 7376]AFY36531.1 pseudaminic acid biosynthesis-associated protein PseG [[Leptolyngbya] sp. PCC 7376]
MNIVIRVDSSQQIGSGHLIRCRTLAEELRRNGAEVRFICREHSGHISECLSQSAFPVTLLPAPPKPEKQSDDYQAWLGVSQETDAAETIEALGQIKADWLIVDHYGLDQIWERKLRPYVNKIFVIDDLANRPHDCEGLLDQNENIEGETRYQGLVPEHCFVLVGCRYALLHPEYAEYRKRLKPRTGEVKRIFIFFGGTDADNMTGMAIAALSSPEFTHINLDVVIGMTNSNRRQLEIQANKRGKVSIYGSRPHLADLMAQADLAIGAGGTTTWERCCLGLPTIVISVANNQLSTCKFLDQSRAILYAGLSSHIDALELRKKIREAIEKRSLLLELSFRSSQLIAGLGSSAITQKLYSSKPSSFSELNNV